MQKLTQEGLSFDDVLVIPRRAVSYNTQVSLKVKLTKTITLNAPIISSPMDTVTESRMAIAMARNGGIGIIHRNMTIEDQATEVEKVKRSEFGVIKSPFSLGPNAYVVEAEELMAKYRISGVPITEYGKLIGILTNRDLRFNDSSKYKKVYEIMTRENLITAPEGTTLKDAKVILDRHKIEKLPIVDEFGDLKGLITTKDILKSIQYPNSAKDESGALLVGAAVGLASDYMERVQALVESLVDIVVIDTPHGHCQAMVDTIKNVKHSFPKLPIMAGNIVTPEATEELINAGADALRVGVGVGSIATTGIVAGVGMPQITAIVNCARVAIPRGVPIVADGGIRSSGDIIKAHVAGASLVMMGSMLAGFEECPGGIELYKGRKYKKYRRNQDESDEPVHSMGLSLPEGVEGRIEYRGEVKEIIQILLKSIQDGMYYCGATSIDDLIENNRFVRVTAAGFEENLPHNLEIL
ncbi:MAG: IMP dehydrogenase [Defluviitaleaceae bacterium]|nr:IMP dehydrogenase [Defluviitaleaceae bacterium]